MDESRRNILLSLRYSTGFERNESRVFDRARSSSESRQRGKEKNVNRSASRAFNLLGTHEGVVLLAFGATTTFMGNLLVL